MNKPVNTRNTAAWVRGVRRCFKIQHRTRTCITRLGDTAALPIPMLHSNNNKKCYQEIGLEPTNDEVETIQWALKPQLNLSC
jgi:hypothetical protein